MLWSLLDILVVVAIVAVVGRTGGRNAERNSPRSVSSSLFRVLRPDVCVVPLRASIGRSLAHFLRSVVGAVAASAAVAATNAGPVLLLMRSKLEMPASISLRNFLQEPIESVEN